MNLDFKRECVYVCKAQMQIQKVSCNLMEENTKLSIQK